MEEIKVIFMLDWSGGKENSNESKQAMVMVKLTEISEKCGYIWWMTWHQKLCTKGRICKWKFRLAPNLDKPMIHP
jgi:hypothetical protein